MSAKSKKYFFIILISLLAEIYIFNFRYWCTLGPEEQSVQLSEITTNENISFEDNRFRLLSTKTADFLFHYSGELKALCINSSVSGDNAPYVYFINTVKSVHDASFRIEDHTVRQKITVFDADGNVLFYKERVSSFGEENSMFINLPTGDYYILTELSYDNSDLSGDVFIDSIYVNKTIPFEFNFFRFLILSLLITFIVSFAPGSKIWSRQLSSIPAIMFPVILSFVILVVIGILNPIWFNETPAVDSYGELTKALSKGQFYTNLSPSPELLQMEDPYDYELREKNEVPYLLDYAYYEGKYYVYFGVIPSVITFLPYYLITGKMMSYSLCFFLVLAFFLSGSALFLSTYIRQNGNHSSYGTYFASYLLLVLMSSINVLFYAWLNYSIPQFFAQTFLIWGAYFYTNAGSTPKSDKIMIAAGSFCFALIAGCRPQLTFCALIAYPLLKNKMLKKNSFQYWIVFIIPYVLVAIPLMYYNYARFGSVTDFGAYYNLTVGQIHKQPFSLTGYKSALQFYLFTIPTFSSEFPWITYHTPNLISENVTPNIAGYFIVFPISLISLFYWPFKSGKSNSTTIFRIILVTLTFFMIAVAYFYLGVRYIFDFGLLLGTESIVMLLDLEQNKNGRIKKLIHAVMIISILIGIIYYYLYFMSSYANMFSLNYSNPDCWYKIYKAVCFWK